MSSKAVTRKRSRAQLQEQDELAQEKDSAPLSNTKKRKLNADSLSPASGGTFGTLKRSLGGLFGFKKNGKENLLEEDEQDELADDDSVNNLGNDKPAKDIWEVGESEPEEAVGKKRTPGRKRSDTTPKSTKLAQKGSAKPMKDKNTSSRKGEDIWEVPESPPRVSRSVSTAERAKALLVPPVKDSSPGPKKRTPGRPRKSDVLKNAKKLSNKAIRDKMMAGADGESEEDEDETGTSTRRRRKKGRAEEDDAVESIPQSRKPSTVKKRGRPSQVQTAEMTETRQSPKGILTPVKQRAGRGRKSVVFDAGDEVDLGFKDLPSSAGTAKSNKFKKSLQSPSAALAWKSKTKVAEPEPVSEEELEQEEDAEVEDEEDQVEEDVESDEVDDEMCEICSGLESTTKNPIMFCDGKDCEFAVHRECYQVAKVPKGDWYCRECEPKANDEVLFTHLEANTAATGNANIPDIEGFDDHLRHMQRILLDRLTGRHRIRLRGHDEELQKVHQVVEQTVLAGEGNSMLVIGARGCGKTTLVESVITDLGKDHRDSFHVVRLNGFIHTDDKLALKETWRQLGREMELEDDVAGKTSNYSDTLASLLALLSHPSEITESEPEQTAKSVLFILDEFDLFTTHPRQTLLYNLFDIAQARKAPIVVLGLTTRVDVVESLEKRVKSRFSHRYVHLSLPRSIPAFWDICKGGLLIEPDELDDESLGFGGPGQNEFVSFWQSMIEDLYNKDANFKHQVQSEFYRSKSVPAFFTSCILPIANLVSETLPLIGKLFTNTLSAPDSKLHILQGLSELELALLIAAARLDIILDTDTCNFAMAYDEYSNLTSRYKIQTSSTGVTALGASAKVWGRDVALGAWERLAEYGLLVPAGIGGGCSRESGAGGRMWKIDVGLEEITGSVDSLSGVMAKWCREI
ncbi:origin recognition complex subunit 4 C-terminus-domain-containing protein [Rhexocercosporidium sp. MPI-PUGE-AT-0058]|nr:origin recognition complex subunit 4 C-terminus-domain-containing protein [Rhexocercosporidium sp. MPI-PUGE-AT-0058]